MDDNSPSLGGDRQESSDHLTGNEPMLEGALAQFPLEELIHKMDDRQRRLFACDCTERILPHLEARYPDDRRVHQAIEVTRRFAEGKASSGELENIHRKVHRAVGGFAAGDRTERGHPLGYVFRAAAATTAQTYKGTTDYGPGVMVNFWFSGDVSELAAWVAAGHAVRLKRYYVRDSQETEETELDWQKQRALWYLQNRDAGVSDGR